MPFLGLDSSMRCSGGTAVKTRPWVIRSGMYLKNRVVSRHRMRPVGVGVGHEDDPAVATCLDVEGASRARPDDLDDRGALGVLEHVGDGRLLHVEDLAPDRQQRLELRVARELGGAERGVTSTMNSSLRSMSLERQSASSGPAARSTPERSCGAGSRGADGPRSGCARRWRPSRGSASPGPSRRAWSR